MAFYGYMWGGLIRLGYSKQSDERYALDTLKEINVSRVLGKVLPDVKKAIRAGVRERYTYKGAVPIKTTRSGNKATLTVKGPRLGLKKFKVRGGVPRRRGRFVTGEKLYVQLVKGQGGIIERGFKMQSGGKFDGTYWRRDTGWSRPIHMIYALSVAQMAGHEPRPLMNAQYAIDRGFAKYLGDMIPW